MSAAQEWLRRRRRRMVVCHFCRGGKFILVPRSTGRPDADLVKTRCPNCKGMGEIDLTAEGPRT